MPILFVKNLSRFLKNVIITGVKNKEIVEPRQICMYIMYTLLGTPQMTIAKIFDKKDHTSVVYARDKIVEAMEENQRIKQAVSDIRSMATKS